MESLRLQGNGYFATNAAEAAKLYVQAMDVYDTAHGTDASCTLEEYTKSAGNALTCLFKVGDYGQCVRLALRALAVNPILAKANAFLGRCALQDYEAVRPHFAGSATALAFMMLCRGVYQLPALGASLAPFMTEAVTRLRKDTHALTAAFAEDKGTTVDVLKVEACRCGNGVVTTAVLPPFTEVASFLHPFSVGLYEETEGQGCCVECSRPLDDLPEDARHSCSTCLSVAYCSLSCAEEHAAQHAAHECAFLCKLKEMVPRIAARQLDVPEEFYELAYHAITTLASMKAGRPGHDVVLHLDAHADEVVQTLHPIGPLLCELFPNEAASVVHTVLGVLRCNAHEVCDTTGLGVAQALHCGTGNIASYFNHSCAPNCAVDPMAHRVITTRAIQPGEELTIAYMPQLYWPTKLRRERLAEGYFFTCQCQRCTATAAETFEVALVKELPTARADATAFFHSIVQARCAAVRAMPVEEVTAEDTARMEKLLQELLQHLFPFHYLCHEVRNTLSFLYAVLGNPSLCLVNCLEELLLWECILPGALPVKQMKLQNILQCMESLPSDAPCGAALYPYATPLALLYDVAEVGDSGTEA